MNKRCDQPTLPWWRVPTVWLVVGGPAAVVVASFITLALAVHGGDAPVRETAAVSNTQALAPATQARNHAVTPRR